MLGLQEEKDLYCKKYNRLVNIYGYADYEKMVIRFQNRYNMTTRDAADLVDKISDYYNEELAFRDVGREALGLEFSEDKSIAELTREMLSPYVDKAIKRKLEEEQDEL
tara:strand:- start:260 stop:583 length:324 start_codon:yes stop_codon:yes gene_type:complete